MNSSAPKALEILLVEDNPGDVVLTREAFYDGHIVNNMSVAHDGEQALEYLRKEEKFKDAVTPDIILLDLNLPKKDGHQVLEEMKADNTLRDIPVVVLTSSKAERDVLQTKNLNANGYLIKPVDIEKLTSIIRDIRGLSFETNTMSEDQ